MDYESARRLLLDQTRTTVIDTFLGRLQRHQAPIPGQVTSILLALKVIFGALQDAQQIDRELAYALFLISNDATQIFEKGLKQQLDCPPLLSEDLERITRSVKSIFSGTWQA